jgi:pimeloyl-ACP methyl ester carboxylesterase
MRIAAFAAVIPHRRLRFTWRRLLVSLLILLLIAYFAISLIAATLLTVPYRRWIEGNPAQVGLQYQDVSFLSRGDRIRLTGWFIPADAEAQNRRVIILAHGIDGCRTCEFQGRALDFAAAMQRRGFSIFMLDLRGHGKSDDAHFTFGLDERRDIQGAVDWLQAQGFQPGKIGLLGMSMGAASSIGAAADEPAIGALVSDSAFADVYSIMQAEFPKQSGLPGFFLPATTFMTRFVIGQDLSNARPVAEIGRVAPRPVLVIHATGDQLVPQSHAEQLSAAAPGSQLWVVPGSGHAHAYDYNPQAYIERVGTFFEQGLR